MSEYILLDGELYHWKYIKREKVNGKYRYYYKDDAYDDARSKYVAKKNKSEANRQTAINIRERANNRKLQERERYVENGWDWVDYTSGYDRLANLTDKLASRDERITQKAKERYERARKRYYSSFGHTVARMLNQRSEISKGKNFVDRLFSNKRNT